MKKGAKFVLTLLLTVGVLALTGAVSSCSSSKTMSPSKKYNSGKVVKQNYKIKGDNKANGSTYRAY